MTDIEMEGAVCPVPLPHNKQIVMGHGSGGKMSADLVSKIFMPVFNNPYINSGDDGAVFDVPAGRMAISTDSHVVSPLFFPGGDIGHLSVCGTVNDVAVMGAKPLYMTAGFVIEEGFSFDVLQTIVNSMQKAADEAGVSIISGDTKIVQRGHADGIYINTTGIGTLFPGININGREAKPGDMVILSGNLGDHGIAVLGARGELGFESDIQSDSAPLNHMIESIIKISDEIHVMRDPTRGGLATTLNEIANQSQVCITINEDSIPVQPSVASVCEMLGYDPLYIANEGKIVVIVSERDSQKVLAEMKKSKYGKNSVVIGLVSESPKNRVLMKTNFGSTRVVDVLTGELLPRIC